MISFKQKGKFKKTMSFLNKIGKGDYLLGISKLGEEGVMALRKATPKDTGKTSESWDYKVEKTKEGISIVWYNTNIHDHQNIAILIQYGHMTGSGYYVEGIDYINPALRPIFDSIANRAWKEVTEDAIH